MQKQEEIEDLKHEVAFLKSRCRKLEKELEEVKERSESRFSLLRRFRNSPEF